MAVVLEKMRFVSDEAWAAAKAAGAAFDAGKLVIPLETSSRAWSTDKEWADGVIRTWTFDLPGGQTLLAVDTNTGRTGWMVSLA